MIKVTKVITIHALFLSILFAQVCPAYGQQDTDCGTDECGDSVTEVYEALDVDMEVYRNYKLSDADVPPARTAVIVTHVIDGYTMIIDNYGVGVVVRLLGVDVPKLNTPEGQACKVYLQTLVENEVVTLEHDNERDECGYLLAQVFFRSKNLSMHMSEFVDELVWSNNKIF